MSSPSLDGPAADQLLLVITHTQQVHGCRVARTLRPQAHNIIVQNWRVEKLQWHNWRMVCVCVCVCVCVRERERECVCVCVRERERERERER